MAEQVVREEGAVPATIAVLTGRPTVGLSPEELESLARDPTVLKASRRDLAVAIVQRRTAATTVAATMFLASEAGIRLMATGGIGGAHRGDDFAWDISADLTELARTPVAVVCSGAKSILDLSRTLEILETWSVPVIGYQCDAFPAFYVRSSGLPLDVRVNTPAEAAELLRAHFDCKGAGLVLAQHVPEGVALSSDEMEAALKVAEQRAAQAGVRGKRMTPYLLSILAEVTQGRTLRVNQALIVANARLAAQVARAG
jgi:pseudouridine-5'-phosphate glycosidase